MLGLAAAALGALGMRLAARTGAAGLERLVAAVVIGAAALVLEALALALVGLGTNSAALLGAAVVAWAAGRALPSRPSRSARAELGCWWRALPLVPRVALGAALGAWVAWTVWLLRWPALGYDSVTYHLPLVLSWVHSGHTGAAATVTPGLPVGNYPLTNEVILAWGMGISRSFVAASLLSPLSMLLLGVAGWAGLARLGVPRWAAGLAIATVTVTPLTSHFQMNGAYTDLPALAWLVCCCTLCVGSAHRARLLPVAVLAAALSVGTKTTTLPFAAITLAGAFAANRRTLRRQLVPLALAAAIGIAVGGFWYLRNTVDHGWPFWPLTAAPWGDPVPPAIGHLDTRFADRPRATLDALGTDYLRLFGGALIALAGALAAALASRRRDAIASAAACLLGLLLWTLAPVSGLTPRAPVAALSTLRYLLPVVAAAALALCLAARGPTLARHVALASLGGAAAVNLWRTFALGFPSVPRPTTVALGAIAGAVAAWAFTALEPQTARLSPSLPRIGSALAAAPLAVAAGALLAVPASGFVRRHADTNGFDASVVHWFARSPAFRDHGHPIAMAPLTLSLLAGDRLQHPLLLVHPTERCGPLWARVDGGWIVQQRQLPIAPRNALVRCVVGRRSAFAGGPFRVYGPGGRQLAHAPAAKGVGGGGH